MKVTRPWDELHEDVEFLLSTGASRDEIVRRLGIAVESIRSAYRRHDVPVPAPLAERQKGRVS